MKLYQKLLCAYFKIRRKEKEKVGKKFHTSASTPAEREQKTSETIATHNMGINNELLGNP